MIASLTYWSCGGEIRAARRPLPPEDADALLGVHLDEARAAIAAGTTLQGLRALDLAAQLHAAVLRSRDWRAAGGPPR
jgi:hypothetical protein